MRPRPKKFFYAEAEAKMYEAEARYSRNINQEQIVISNISSQPMS